MSGDTCLANPSNVVTEKTDLVIMQSGSAYLYSAGLLSFTHYMWLLSDVNYSLGQNYEVSGQWKFGKSCMKYNVIYDA
jgi:hypothetical protein